MKQRFYGKIGWLTLWSTECSSQKIVQNTSLELLEDNELANDTLVPMNNHSLRSRVEIVVNCIKYRPRDQTGYDGCWWGWWAKYGHYSIYIKTKTTMKKKKNMLKYRHYDKYKSLIRIICFMFNHVCVHKLWESTNGWYQYDGSIFML